MAEVTNNPIKKYERGLPCMLGQVVGRIVGESEKGSWGYIDEVQMFSIPFFATPHGSVIETGVLFLSEITEEGLAKLKEFEADAKAKCKELYDGRINDIEI